MAAKVSVGRRSGIYEHLKIVDVNLYHALISHLLSFLDIIRVTNWLGKTFGLKVVCSCWARRIWNLPFACVTA